MTAAQLFQTLTAGGCRLLQDGGQLRIQDPQHALTDDLRQAIRTHKTGLLALLTQTAPVHDATTTAPSIQEACSHQAHFPPTPTDGPLRQCAACPHCWYVPCACGAVTWKFIWQDGPPLWFCLACGAVYGSIVRVTAAHAAECLWYLKTSTRCTCDPVLTIIREAPAPRGQDLGPPPATWCCPLCHGTRRWRSVYDVLICGACHPPGSAALVSEGVEHGEEAP